MLLNNLKTGYVYSIFIVYHKEIRLSIKSAGNQYILPVGFLITIPSYPDPTIFKTSIA